MRFAFVTNVFAILSLAGCASPQPYNAGDAPTKLLTRESNGLRVSVDVVLDSQRSQKYFGTNALDDGIVPVFVRVENVASAGSVLVEKEHFSIAVNATGPTGAPMAGEVQHRSQVGDAVTVAGLVSLPLLLVGGPMSSAADESRHSFVDKEFRNQSLAPGRSAQGFIYYQLNNRKSPIEVVRIAIQTRNLQTDQQTTFEFDVPAEQISKR